MAARLALGLTGKMRINDHFHSQCSFDAEFPLTQMCRAAVSAGVDTLCLTDHCDLMDEYGKPDDSFDWALEDRELAAAKAMFPGLHVRRGIELGQALLRPEAATRVISDPDIDFVLGSMHNCALGQDFYWLHLTDPREALSLLEQYLQYLLELSRTEYLDSLAHLTYPLRYLRNRDGLDVDLHPMDDLVREILKTLVERGKALEINTSGYRQGMGEPLPSPYILEMYRELGGELLTIGTDAHEPRHMAAGLEQGVALIRKIGFRYVTIYEKRKPKQIKMEEIA